MKRNRAEGEERKLYGLPMAPLLGELSAKQTERLYEAEAHL